MNIILKVYPNKSIMQCDTYKTNIDERIDTCKSLDVSYMVLDKDNNITERYIGKYHRKYFNN